MPYPPAQPLAPPLGLPQQQMRNRIALQMMRPLGAPAALAPRPAVMPPQFNAGASNQQALQQQQQQQTAQLQQQRALSELFSPRGA